MTSGSISQQQQADKLGPAVSPLPSPSSAQQPAAEGNENEVAETELDWEEETKAGEEQQQRQQRPEEYLTGQWDAEPFYYSSGGPTAAKGYQIVAVVAAEHGESTDRRQKRGVIYKRRENVSAANEYECFQSQEGVVYRPGDQVFLEGSREEPWVIGNIVSFKMKKRDQLLVKLLRYYRPSDVPEVSFSLVTQERIEEGHFHATRQSHARELFSSESSLLFHVSALRGKCSVKLVKDLRSALAEVDLNDPDSFFHCLNYNQESGRLSSVQMSIRVGSAYQADVPTCSSSMLSDEPDRDELLYRPGYLCAQTEQKYVKMARAFRTFSLMNNKRITLLEKQARTGDLLFDDAVTALHRSGYSVVESVRHMQAIDQHLTADSSFLSPEDVKKFGRGIKQFGKNFNKINRELLPQHRREQLVAFYYLWKKSRDATRPKPLSTAKRNQVAAAVGRRGKNGANNGQSGLGAGNGGNGNGNGKTPTASENGLNGQTETSVGGGECGAVPTSEDLMDYASASEAETEQIETLTGCSGRACHHCFASKSRDWHHAGRDKQLMCTECRVFYKKYGQLRPVERPCTVPPCLLRAESNEDDENEEPVLRVRTRGAAAGRQKPRRAPSSLDGEQQQRLRITPQKMAEDGGNGGGERRNTPLRNAKTASGGRKRAYRESDGDEQTPPASASKSKRQKKASPSESSRTPSPPTAAVAGQSANGGGEERKEREEGEQERAAGGEPKEMKRKSPRREREGAEVLRKASAQEGTVTPPPVGHKSNSRCPSAETGNSKDKDNSPPIEQLERQREWTESKPEEMVKKEVKEEEAETTCAEGKGSRQQPQQQLGAGGTGGPIALTAGKKPVAKVEPLDKKREGKETDGEEDGREAICVSSDGEEGPRPGQDMGPRGEPDRLVVYRTEEGKEFEGKKLGPERTTVLERRLKRCSGLTCARVDLAFVEVPERAKHRQMEREKRMEEKRMESEKSKRQQAGNAGSTSQQQHAGSRQQQNQQQMAGGAKKMEMPAEFGAVVPNGHPPHVGLPSASVSHPMTGALLMNGLMGPGAIGLGPHQSVPSATAVNGPPVGGHSTTVGLNPQHMTAAGAQQAHHPLLGPSTAQNQAAVAFLQQQQEQALVMQMLSDPVMVQQLQSLALLPRSQQPAALLAGATAQQQSAVAQQQQQQHHMLQMQMLMAQQQQQDQQKLLEQLQRQHQQHQKQQPQRQQGAHLNGQHPNMGSSQPQMLQQQQQHQLVNGLGQHQGMQQQQHRGLPHLGQPQNSQQLMHQQQQHKEAQQQQQAVMNMVMQQLLGPAAHHQQQQQQAAAMLALQHQPRPPPPHQQHPASSSSGTPSYSAAMLNHPVAAGNGPQQQSAAAHFQQQQQMTAMLAAEMAALAGGGPGAQQQFQQLLAIMGMGGTTAGALEEQFRTMSQQQQHQQQQLAVSQAQAMQQQSQQQQLMAALVGAMPGISQEQQLQLAQGMATAAGPQQHTIHGQQTQQQGTSAAQQQFQQQLLQVMVLQQQQHQQQAQQAVHQQQQMATIMQQQNMMDMVRRMQQGGGGPPGAAQPTGDEHR